MRIGFVTYRELPLITSDDQLVVDELNRLGIEVLPIIWEENNNLEPSSASAVSAINGRVKGAIAR